MIAAVGPQRVIGADNELPWRLPKDLKFFRRVTLGHVVIMGRMTFDSFNRRALPKRENIVLSRTSRFEGTNLHTAQSLEEALILARRLTTKNRVFIIGGQKVYEQALPLADELFLSRIEDRGATKQIFGSIIQGDAFFPRIPLDEWCASHVGRYFKAKNTLKRAQTSSELFFRIWKLRRKNADDVSQNDGPTNKRNERIALTSEWSD